MDIDKKLWVVYINYKLSKLHSKKYFEGSKEKLMALVGCLHSTTLEEIDVWYCESPTYILPEERETLSYFIDTKECVHVCSTRRRSND